MKEERSEQDADVAREDFISTETITWSPFTCIGERGAMGPKTAAMTCVEPDFHKDDPSARCRHANSHDRGRGVRIPFFFSVSTDRRALLLIEEESLKSDMSDGLKGVATVIIQCC